MTYGRPLFDLRMSMDKPIVEVHNIEGFSYSGVFDGKMIFRRHWTDPEDKTFQKLNEVNSASSDEKLKYTNTVHVSRRNSLFTIRCYFEGPRLGMLNGKNALIDTTPESDGYYCSQGFREIAEGLI